MTSWVRVETQTTVGLRGLGPLPTASPVAIGAHVPFEIRRSDVVHPEAMVESSDQAGFGLADGPTVGSARRELRDRL